MSLDSLPDVLVRDILVRLSTCHHVRVRAVSTRFRGLVQSLQTPAGERITQCLAQLHAALHGDWRGPLFQAARQRALTGSHAGAGPSSSTHRSGDERAIQFSSFCVPDAQTCQDSFALVTDGFRVQFLNDHMDMIQGHIAPQFQHPPHRQHLHAAPVASPLPLNSIPDLKHLSLLILHPVVHGPKHIRQWHTSPQLYGAHDTWPPRAMYASGADRLAAVMCALVDTVTDSAATSSTDSQEPDGSNSLPDTEAHVSTESSEQTCSTSLALVLPRVPMWLDRAAATASQRSSQSASAGLYSSPSRSVGRHRAAVASPSPYVPEPYDTQTDLALQLLSKALALQPPTYLDISHASELRDSDLTVILAKASKSLKHLVMAGTQFGPLCLMMLASNDRLNLCSLDLSHSLHASMGRVDSHEPRRGGSAPRPSHSVSHTGPPHTHVTLSRSPPASLVSGLAAMEQGLRHRHPSKLVTVTQQGNTGSESSRDKDSSAHAEPVLPSQPVLGVAAPTAQEGLAPASGGSGAALAVPLFCRLLRSALGRLTCLTDLRLAGNDLTGLLQAFSTVTTPTATSAAPSPLDPALSATLARLHTLDISHCTGITHTQLTTLLHVCSSLIALYAHSCRSLAADAASVQVQPQQAAQPEPPVRCSLRRLSCGWGFTASLLTSVCCNSPQLVSLELGVGSGVSDGVLQTVAEQCPLLERVKLKLACVSDQGVRALLGGCPRIHVLHLNQCVGPFTAALLPNRTPTHRSTGPAAAMAATAATAAASQHRWTLTELLYSGPTLRLTDTQLRQLIGTRPRTLRALSLCDMPLITPATLTWLGTCHGATLQHVALKQCGAGPLQNTTQASAAQTCGCPRAEGLSESASGVTNAAGQQGGTCVWREGGVQGQPRVAPFVWRITESDILSLLSACPGLRSLELRHCCTVSVAFVESVMGVCPLIESLTLDQCGLVEKGVTMAQDPYAALQQVVVQRCKWIDPAVSPQEANATGDRAIHSSDAIERLSARLRRRMSDDMLVHDLLEGRTARMSFD